MIDAGSVVLVIFPGAQQTKPRPAVVISTAVHQTTHGDVVLGVLTSNLAQASGPTDYILQDSAAAGLHKASAFRVFLVTKPASDVVRVLGKLTNRDWQEVKSRLRLALAVT
jgi:mRNA-degrading endonuclease toxin of MazEF toxin-antitoxin module